jgi:hypothetical protein
MEYDNSYPVSIDSSIITVDNSTGERALDPAKLIGQLPNDIQSIKSPLILRFKSDVISVDLDYNMFLSKLHTIDGDYIRIGYRKLDMKDLKIEVVYRVSME